MDDTGGDAACWAHLGNDGSISFDEAVRGWSDDDGSGVVWSLPRRGELDANVVRLVGGGHIGEHVNDVVDVLIVVWSGSGEATIDDRRIALHAGTIVHIDRGRRRSIAADLDGLVYLSTHPRRPDLQIGNT